jgi:imidazolonepropionase-like amidohydrolase
MGKRTVIKAGFMIDGNGNTARDQVLVIEGKTLTEVFDGESLQPRSDDEIIDATHHTVMPGLIDCHVHTRSNGDPRDRATMYQTNIAEFAYRALRNAWKDLEAGYTSLRDVGGMGYIDVTLRDAFERGDFKGPRMRVAGCGLTQWGGHMHRFMRPGLDMIESTGVVNNPGEAQSAARYQIGRGVDGLKFNTAGGVLNEDGKMVIHQEMDYDMLAAAMKEARKVGAWSATHCHGGQGATDAILAGISTIDHGHWLTDEQFAMMKERGTIFVPTLCANENRYRLGMDGVEGDKKAWRWLEIVMEDKTDTLQRALKAGVLTAAGSDAGMVHTHHGELAREMEYLVRRAMTPMQAIVASTKIAAMTMKLDHKTGTLEAGKWADVLIVKGNPLDDISILSDKNNILLVMKDGARMVERGPFVR